MNEKDIKTILYGYLAESETIELAFIKTQKHTTKALLDELLPTFDITPETIELIHALHIARSNTWYFETKSRKPVIVGFSDPKSFEFLIHLYSTLRAGFKYLCDHYDDPSLTILRRVHTKPDVENLVNTFGTRLNKIEEDYALRKALKIHPMVFAEARNIIDLTVQLILGDEKQDIVALRFNEDWEILRKLKKDFKTEPD